MSVEQIQRLIVGLYAVALPTFVVCMLLELRLQRRRPIGRGYDLADARTSLALGILMVVGSALMRTTILAVHTWFYRYRLFDLPVGAAWVWPLALLGDDFAFYWYHRVHHRVHHGKNLQYLDRNYGGILIVWDRLFGTFEEEVEPVRFGLTHPVPVERGILHAFSHELVAIARDVRSAGALGRALGFVFGPPGWGHGETTAELLDRDASAKPTD